MTVSLELCPQETNLCVVRGDTTPWTFTILDSSGAAVNISGYSFLLTVDPSEEPGDDSANLFQLTGTITDAANGVVQFAMTAGQADQVPSEYYFDLQMTDGVGSIRTVAKGVFEFKQDITK